MATLAELIKGFRHNVRVGYQTTLIFTGEQIHLTCENQKGYVGISNKPSITQQKVEILFTREQNEHLTRTAKLQADVAIMGALKELVSMYICYTEADKNLIKCLKHLEERINRPYLPRDYPPKD